MAVFDSLTLALDGWFEAPASDLPDALRLRVEKAFSVLAWDDLNAERRRSVALQRDQQDDPAMAEANEFWFDFPELKRNLEAQILEWETSKASTSAELTQRESRLTELRRDLARMKNQERMDQRVYEPTIQRPDQDAKASPPANKVQVEYLPYPRALRRLIERFNATPEELAAWVWLGPALGGLSAYLNANELEVPPRFHFDMGDCHGEDHDYVSALMACWFGAVEIAEFNPVHRYITGAALIQRWSDQPGVKPVAFIHAKIKESRLQDMHPMYGMTQASHPTENWRPPRETALFLLAEVGAIESEDFGSEPAPAGTTIASTPESTQPPLMPPKPVMQNEGESSAVSAKPSQPAEGASGHDDDQFEAAAEPLTPAVGSAEWRSMNARAAANAMHDRPGGSRDKKRQIREIWARGNYSDRDTCAEQECAALGMPFATARRALRNTPEPVRPSAESSKG